MERMSHSSFLWRSLNLHGIHSPFVYGIASKYFYGKYYPQPDKELFEKAKGMSKGEVKVLYKICAAIQPAKIYVLGNNAEQATEVIRLAAETVKARPWFFSPLAPIPGVLDMAYIASDDKQELEELLGQVKANCAENTPIIVGGIRNSSRAEAAWEYIKRTQNVTVTIDTYHLGLIFLRSGQVKQHFLIRYRDSLLLKTVLGIRNLWGLTG